MPHIPTKRGALLSGASLDLFLAEALKRVVSLRLWPAAPVRRDRLDEMTNPIAKVVHCPTCGAPPGRACQQLRPDRIRVVPTHSARRKLLEQPVRVRTASRKAPRSLA
ncbi:zinc finger domain-containing protein [Bradyrhizobium erythrophlei]|uniref:zinc finger domain-containing protein n=1 Tax=Bradyrhizobium erythrophlei TaxID=1437360 RepID=UPI003CC7F8C0